MSERDQKALDLIAAAGTPPSASELPHMNSLGEEIVEVKVMLSSEEVEGDVEKEEGALLEATTPMPNVAPTVDGLSTPTGEVGKEEGTLFTQNTTILTRDTASFTVDGLSAPKDEVEE